MMNSTSPPVDGSGQERLRVADKIQNPYSEQPMPAVGDKIGPNRVELLVGEGGMANVYKVWNEGLEVVRAVKVLKKAFHQESKERFLTEAKILADIHHPNIVQIHNIGYIDRRIPFIEMEFVEGASLKKLLLRHSRLPLPVALSAVYFAGQALHYAHGKDYTLYGKVYHGLIHRDIKPDNIVISHDGIVKLMDFGIARPSEISLHTVGAKIVGTLIYLSPEQLNGASLDCRSDLFSLGAVLYELITGNRLFPQKSLQELVQKKMKGIYRPLSEHGIPVPPSVTAIIGKCLALNPDDRFANAASLGEAVFAALHDITDRAPQDILSRYMANPDSITSVTISTQRRGKTKSAKGVPMLWWLIIGTAAATAAGTIAALLYK